jgi:DNA modification methylase
MNQTNQNQKIQIKDVKVSDLTRTLYDYSNRESEINSLVMSISTIGQQQPITVVRDGSGYVVLDGVLRLWAIIRLNLNEIDAIVCEFTGTDEISLTDLIIHNQIHKQKTVGEKLNEVKSLLRIDSDVRNTLRDKEERVRLISSLLGDKGWGRNNVFSLEKILRWEKSSNSDLQLAEKILSKQITIYKALGMMELIINPRYTPEKEKESRIIEGFVKGHYNKERAVKLMRDYDSKKSVRPTEIPQHSIIKQNFKIIQGNIEEIELPEELLIDTIFTSPPYYNLKKYGNDPDELGWEETPDLYVERITDILMKCYEKLRNTGSMFINLGETYQDHKCLGITERLTVELMSRGVRYVDRLIWKKDANKPFGNGMKRLIPGYETILHFSKTKDYYFEPFKIKGEKTSKVARGCKDKVGSEPSYHIRNNYDQFRTLLSENEVSNVISVQANKNRTKHIEGEVEHPATFSFNLPVIPLLISTPKNGDSVVFDPFMGTGSCGVAALTLGFKFVGVELYEENIITAQRILTEGQEQFDEDSLNSFLEEYGSSEDSNDITEDNQAA